MSPNRWEQPAVYLQSGDPEQENTPTLYAPGLLGARFTGVQPTRGQVGAESVRSKRYQIIKTDSTMAVAPFPGAVALWSDKTQYMVTTDPTKLGRGRLAGVFQCYIQPGNFGCVQVEGPATVKFLDAPTSPPDTSGKFVIASATPGKADCIVTAPTFPTIGVTAGTVQPDATAIVDLNVPETT